MQRRHLLSTAAAGLLLGPHRATAQRLIPQQFLPGRRLCRVRPNINSLPTAQLAALKQGVQVMMSRPASDPTSWAYQAAIHGTAMTPSKPLWNQCQHGNEQFFSWHRLFLYRFELILRQASGSPSLTLPFWDWTTDPTLPAPFRDNTPGNPLFTPHRKAAVNAGAPLPASAVPFAGAFTHVPFTSFSSSFEGTPHGSVHVSVGGWMAVIDQSAQDPIFWLHHANVDRLWSAWLAQGGGRQDPTTAAWLNQSFSFFETNGSQVAMKVTQTIDSCRDLGYVYPRVNNLIFNPSIIAGLTMLHLAAAPTMRSVEPVSGASLALGPKPAEARFPMAPAREALSAHTAAAPRHVYLSFEDVKVTDPEGYYEVYLNPPSSGPLEATDRSYAGNLVLFGLEGGGANQGHMGAPSRTLDITQKLMQLGIGNVDELRVVLVLREAEGAAISEAPHAQVGRFRLLTGP